MDAFTEFGRKLKSNCFLRFDPNNFNENEKSFKPKSNCVHGDKSLARTC